jgi:hypothetical protein
VYSTGRAQDDAEKSGLNARPGAGWVVPFVGRCDMAVRAQVGGSKGVIRAFESAVRMLVVTQMKP